jgi:hypothetical protein
MKMSNYKKGPYGTDDMADVLDGLGTASTRSVQTSPTDATAGRVLTVGAFGLGAMDTPINNSISAVLPAGFYQTDADATGFPVINSSRLVFGRSSTRRAELYIGTQSANPQARAWVRGGDPSVAAFQELYHTGNLNTLEFGGVGVTRVIARGEATSTTTARFYLPINLNAVPTSVTIVGTFDVVRGTTVVASNVTGSLNPISSNRVLLFDVTTTGLTVGDQYNLRQNSASSKITVNP